MNHQVFIRINGIGHSFSRELGCTCDRCRVINFSMAKPPTTLLPFSGWDDPPWRAHTSASIFLTDDNSKIQQHILIDVGAGVIDSLMCTGITGLDQISGLLLTHWHPDHTLGLNQFCESMQRSAKSNNRNKQKIPLYCTNATYQYLIGQGGQKFIMNKYIDFIEIFPEIPFVLDTNPSIRFMPIPVAHGSIEGAVIFLAEIGITKKVVFAWDIDVPSKIRPSGKFTNLDVFNNNRGLFKQTDILFIAANTWNADGTPGGGNIPTGHSSYQRAKDYINLIEPEKVYIAHMSGHEDGSGNDGYGWTDARWELEVKKDNVKIARQGMVIAV